MATDVYVMPMWRFRTGEVESSLAAFARKSGIGFQTIRLVPRVSPGRLLRHFRARRYVSALQRKLGAQIGKVATWRDEGEVQYNHQFHAASELKTYAHWIDYRDELPEYKEWREAANVYRIPREHCSFPLIKCTNFWSGYIVPIDFPHVAETEEDFGYGERDIRKVTSAQALLREVEGLDQYLEVPDDWDFHIVPGKPHAPMGCLHQLRELLRLSVKHELPIMFDG